MLPNFKRFFSSHVELWLCSVVQADISLFLRVQWCHLIDNSKCSSSSALPSFDAPKRFAAAFPEPGHLNKVWYNRETPVSLTVIMSVGMPELHMPKSSRQLRIDDAVQGKRTKHEKGIFPCGEARCFASKVLQFGREGKGNLEGLNQVMVTDYLDCVMKTF